jgi:osmoprotectant transport system permease protein
MRAIIQILLISLCIPSIGIAQEPVKVGSKLFNESVILGEMITQIIESGGEDVTFFDQLGGTRILWNSVLQGEIDIYPEYSGTIIYEILDEQRAYTNEELNERLSAQGIQISKPIGFNNTYALGMNRELSVSLGIDKISDLLNHASLKFGFSNEFIDRNDGWRGLQSAYNLPQFDVIGLDHDLAYRGLESGSIDLIDLYSTDAEIAYYDLKVLEDDLSFFPSYQAVIVYRSDLDQKIVRLIIQLESSISENNMVAMNAAVKIEGRDEIEVASEFLTEKFNIQTNRVTESVTDQLIKNTIDHLILVLVSLSFAILIALPLGIIAAKSNQLAQPILSIVGVLQTIPSLALLVFMIPLFGIGTFPAMAALFLYSLLPIVRNTHSGITEIDPNLKESALALGLPKITILKKIELPLATPTILAGIKTSAVINVGTATLGALIGAGGYGQPILTGIRLDDVNLILQGAIPAALLALSVQWVFDSIEKRMKYS